MSKNLQSVSVGESTVRLVCLADTHGKHRKVNLPDGDVLVHAGDFTNFGNQREDFLDWFTDQPFDHRVLILGNHEKMGTTRFAIDDLEQHLSNREDLHFVGYRSVTIKGITFGPAGGDPDVNVVMTHQPPVSILDNGKGLKGLRETVARQSPTVHVFGHIHESYGRRTLNKTTCVNCALAGPDYEPVNAPQVVELSGTETEGDDG